MLPDSLRLSEYNYLCCTGLMEVPPSNSMAVRKDKGVEKPCFYFRNYCFTSNIALNTLENQAVTAKS